MRHVPSKKRKVDWFRSISPGGRALVVAQAERHSMRALMPLCCACQACCAAFTPAALHHGHARLHQRPHSSILAVMGSRRNSSGRRRRRSSSLQPRLASRPGGHRRRSRCRSSRCRTPRRSRCTSSGRRSRLPGTRHRACRRSARGCRRRGCHRGCSNRCSRRGCGHRVCLARRSQGRSDACTAPKSATLDSGDARVPVSRALALGRRCNCFCSQMRGRRPTHN